MLRSLYSGITGMRSHQTMVDVTGNNIANVNTTGYKASGTVFQDTLSQMVNNAGAPQAGVGGTNPAQVGLGVRIGGILGNFTQGAAQNTGRPTDLMLNGDGFFLVRGDGNQQLFTRAGAFSFDAGGNLTTQEGRLVLGWQANAAGVIDPTAAPVPIELPAGLQSYSFGPDGVLTGVLADGTKQPIAQLAIATFVNPAGLERVGGTAFRTTVNSGAAQVGAAGTGGRGTISAGSLEMSNVDLSQEFTNLIVAQRGFQANSRIITASDEVLQDPVNLKR
jgi:flagellar hook protein FlgE